MTTETNSEHRHIYPEADYIDHELHEDKCICGPTTKAIAGSDGIITWEITHYSLDGREKRDKQK